MRLLEDLKDLAGKAEIILSSTEPPPAQLHSTGEALGLDLKWITGAMGRGRQLNHAAKEARKPWLWFLHADSRIEKSDAHRLLRSVERYPAALHYFNLRFDLSNLKKMGLNSAGVWFRSHVLQMPFGDQGFCIDRKLFERLGAFKEDAPYGEDHLFVWKARQRSVPLRCTGGWITTSARRYQERGWLKTTIRHLGLTALQAAPEAVRLVKTRLKKPASTTST